MRKFLITALSLVLLLTCAAHAVISCFATTSMHYDYSAGPYVSPPINTTGADLLVAISGSYVSNGPIYDNLGNKWQYAGMTTNLESYVYFSSTPMTSSSHIFGINVANNYYYGTTGQFEAVQVYACSGSDTIHPVGAVNGTINNSTLTFTTGPVSYNTGDLIVTGTGALQSPATATSISPPFSTPIVIFTSSTISFASSFFVATSPGTINPTWTVANATTNYWSASIVVFRAATDSPLPNNGPFIYTVAGSGLSGAFTQDNQSALSGSIGGWPGEIKFDANGNLIFADVNDNYILGFNRSGATQNILGVSTCGGCMRILAGTNPSGFSGDGGPPLLAKMAHPVGFAIDLAGNVYVADQQNNRIRKIAANGSVITTVAGGGSGGGAGACSSSFAGDTDNVLATNALLNCPQGVGVDAAGNIYVSDSNNAKLKVVNTQATAQTILGVSIPSGFIKTIPVSIGYPLGSVLDSSGNIYIADFGNYQVIKIDTSGVKTIVAGNGTSGYSGDGGLATAAQLAILFDVALDTSNNVFIADAGNNNIRKVDAITRIITTITGDNSIYSGGLYSYAGDGSSAKNAGLAYPIGIVVAPNGDIFIGDAFNYVVREVRSTISGGRKMTTGIKVTSGTRMK